MEKNYKKGIKKVQKISKKGQMRDLATFFIRQKSARFGELRDLVMRDLVVGTVINFSSNL